MGFVMRAPADFAVIVETTIARLPDANRRNGMRDQATDRLGTNHHLTIISGAS